MKQPADMSDAQWDLLFNIHRSIRYHDKRKAFFELLHRGTNVITILFAGNVLFMATHPDAGGDPGWLTAIALFGSILATIDLVIGYASRASLHSVLRQKFCDLEIAIRCTPEDNLDIAALTRQRLEIEKDEPSIYRALDLVCYNECVNAFYDPKAAKDNQKVVPIFKRLTKHFIHWNAIAV